VFERGPFWLEAVDGLGVDISVRWVPVLVSLPGVALKTEYSSANVGVHPVWPSNVGASARGVWKIGLEKTPDVGVCVGVGG
jgi:hypothetical protein